MSSSTGSGSSPRKTSVRCRFSGGTGLGTGRPCADEHQLEAHRLGQRDRGEGADHRRARLGDELEHHRADVVDDRLHALGVRVQPVATGSAA